MIYGYIPMPETRLSLNEIEALSKKATRGAGYSWGLAEEAGKINKWLAGRGVDSLPSLRHLLETYFSAKDRFCKPDPELPGWCPDGAVLCPVYTGCAMQDFYSRLPKEMRIRNLVSPAQLIGSVGLLSDRFKVGFEIRWHETRILFRKDTFNIQGTGLNTELAEETMIRIFPETGIPGGIRVSTEVMTALDKPEKVISGGFRVSTDVMNALDNFTHKNYVPASEKSRAGAGSTLNDND